MSTLQQILAEHSRSITDNISHASDIATENADRKANNLEERFQHVKDTIESAGGELAAIGGAYHIGRKVYKRIQQAKQAGKALMGEGTDYSSGDFNNLKIDLQDGQEPGTALKESGGNTSTPKQPTETPEANPENITTEDQPTAGETSGETQAVQPEQAEASASGGGGSEGADTITDPDIMIGGRGAYDIENVREGAVQGPLQQRPTGDLMRNIETEGQGEAADPDVIQKTSGEVTNDFKIADEAADTGADDAIGALRQTGSDILGKTSNMVVNNADSISQTASKLAGMGGDAISAGLDTASAVLDALGPVGEAAGIITSLVGLFEGLGHDKKDVETTGQEAGVNAPTSTAIDPKALQMATM